MNKYLKKGLKITAWIIGSIIALFLLLVLLIQVPAVQNFLKDKAVNYLEKKIGTPVGLGRIEIGLPKKVILEDLFLQSQNGDTLLSGNKIAVDISLFKLLDNEVEINSVALNGIVANVIRDKDSVYNFDYIIKAFASDKPTDPDATPMRFSLSRVNLDNIRVNLNDAISRNDLVVRLRHFDTNVKTFDLEDMNFDVPRLKMDGLKVNMKQGELIREIATVTVETADSIVKKRPDLNIRLGEIDFTNIDLAYDNAGTRLNSGLTLQKLLLKFDKTDLPKQQIDISRFELVGLDAGLTFGKYDNELTIEKEEGVARNDWKVSLKKVKLQRINFRFDDENASKANRGIDYKHLNISDLNLDASDLSYNANVIAGSINDMSLNERSGLTLEQLQTDFYYGPRSAYLKNLYLKTPGTLLRDNVIVNYPSLDAISKSPSSVAADISLKDARLAIADLLIFAPQLQNTNPFRSHPDAIMYLNTRINGRLDNLNIPTLRIRGIGTTILAARGRITGLPDFEKAWFDLNIDQIQTSSSDIASFVPPNTLPSNLRLPEAINLKGKFKGSISNFSTDLSLTTNRGNAKVNGMFDRRIRDRERYKGTVALDNFDLGRLLKNDSIGNISLNARVDGTGLNPKTANATVDATLIRAGFNGYTYRNLAINGNIRQGSFVANAGMNDPNLTFALASEGRFDGNYPTVKMKLNVDIADLNKLNLHAGPLKLRGIVDADISNSDPDMLNGRLNAYHFVIANEKEQFQLDSVSVEAVSTSERSRLLLRSQFVNAEIDGKYQLTKVGTAVSNSIAAYYDTNPARPKQQTGPQQFAFDIRVTNDPVIMKLVPQITRIEPISIKGRYNSVNDTIVLDASIPRLIYGANTISNGLVKVEKQDNALVYSLVIDEIQNEQFRLPFTSIEGSLSENILRYRLNLKDEKDQDRYIIAGLLEAKPEATEIRLLPEDLMLNYDRWIIADNNVVRFGNRGIYADNFELSNEGSALRLQSQSEAVDAPLEATFKDFSIETISRMVQQDSVAFGGRINGEVILKNLRTRPVFTSDLNIDTFTFKKDTVGNLSIKVNNEVANTFAANVELTGQGNQLNLEGTYLSTSGMFDMRLDIDRLNLESIQPFTAGNIAKSTGYVSGDFDVTGTVEKPKLIGELQFHDGAFTVTKLNSPFKLMNDRISFTPDGLVFTRFSLSDAEDNVLTITGNIDTPDYRNYAFNVNVNANNFRATNSSAKDNEIFYGKLYLDTRLRIKGDLNKPVIDGTLKINEDTRMTVVLPQSDPSIADREGIVEFIDQDNPQLTEPLMTAADSITKSVFRGMNVAVNIEIDKDAELTMVIDEGNGDFVKVKGEARLSGGIDESGKTTLTGRYELNQGSYEMSFNFLRRKFDIEEGSYILWTGEPTTADINVTAVYRTETAPIDLLDDQLGAVSPTVRNTYKQRIPFETVLNLKGELMKPQITFDIRLPEGNHGVSSDIITNTRAKLDQLRQEPSELNKQVFALLLLNRFVGENPFASESGVSTETMARQSVSKILSQQLNDLAGNMIDGVELTFDLESSESYTTGQSENRTDLNVGVSKRLLDDRLKVTVGSSFGIEGEEQANQQANNIAGDVSADYQLSKDGRYTLRAYRKNEYQVALQGQIIETGLAFVITMDYNKFRELFHRTQEEKRLKRQMKRKKAEDKERQKALEAEKAREAETNGETEKP